MSEPTPGLLERLGPLGFLILVVLVAAAIAFYRGGEQRSVALPVADTGNTATVSGTEATGALATPVENPPQQAGEAVVVETPIPESDALSAAPVEPAQEEPVPVPAATTGAEQPAATDAADSGQPPAAPRDVAAVAATSPAAGARFAVSEAAGSLAERARALFSGQAVFDHADNIDERARTALVELVDTLAGNDALAIGIATRLDQSADATHAGIRAETLRGFFRDHGIDAARIVAGVLIPEYRPDSDGVRQVEFFFAERQEP